MAWKFPKRNTRRNSPIDVETVNENIQEFTSEIGNLNEHNWSATSPICQKDMQIPANTGEDSAVKIHSKAWYSEHRIGATHTENFTPYKYKWDDNVQDNNSFRESTIPPYGPRHRVFLNLAQVSLDGATDSKTSESFDYGIIEDAYSSYDSYCSAQKNYCPTIEVKTGWQVIQRIEATAQASLMWVVASFALFQESLSWGEFKMNRGGGFSGGTVTTIREWGQNKALSEKYGGPKLGGFQFGLRLNGEIIWETVTGSGEFDNDKFSAMGLMGPCPITLDAIIPVSAGEFNLEIVSRILRQENACEGYVPTGELTAIEFRR